MSEYWAAAAEGERKYRQLLRDAGLPPSTESQVWITPRLARGEAPFELPWLQIEPHSAITETEMQTLARAGVGIRLTSVDTYDATELLPYVEAGGQGVWLERYAGTVSGSARLLENGSAIRILRTSGGFFSEWPGRFNLPELVSITADTEPLHWACQLPTLRDVMIEHSMTFDGSLLSITLEYLGVEACPRFRDLQRIPSVSNLRGLSVRKSPFLSLAYAREAKNLENILIDSVKRVTGVNALKQLDNLQLVEFSRVQEVQDAEDLLEVRSAELRILNNCYLRQLGPSKSAVSQIHPYTPPSVKISGGLIEKGDFASYRDEWGDAIEVDLDLLIERRLTKQDIDIPVDHGLLQNFGELMLHDYRAEQPLEIEARGEVLVFRGKSAAALRRLRDHIIEVWNDDGTFRDLATRAHAASRLELRFDSSNGR